MMKISSQEEYMSVALGREAKLWIEQSTRQAPSGVELRIQFRALRSVPLDVLPSYEASPEPAAGGTAAAAAAAAAAAVARSWPPTPVAATIFMSPDDLEGARSKRLLVTRAGGCKDLMGFVTAPDTDIDGLAVVNVAQIEEKAKALVPAGVELLVSTETSSTVTGLVD